MTDHYAVTAQPSSNRGQFDIIATNGEHLFRFLGCTVAGERAAAFVIEQLEAMSARDFAINCEHCPEQGAPTGVNTNGD